MHSDSLESDAVFCKVKADFSSDSMTAVVWRQKQSGMLCNCVKKKFKKNHKMCKMAATTSAKNNETAQT